MAILIDASVLIRLERQRQDLDELMRILPRERFELASITVSELLVGVYRADSLGRREGREHFVERAIERYPVLPFDIVVARRHAELWAELAAAGRMIGLHDMQVAATALAHRYSVLTENVRDFERVPGLTVRRPEWR